MKRVVGSALLFVLLAAGAAFAEYPEKPIQGYVMWGAGGALDNVSRAAAPNAADALGKSIIMQNKTGATGAIALTTVANAAADGYSILFGAENPNLYKVTGISEFDYDQFDPIILLMANVGVVVVPKDSPYKTYADLIAAAKSGKTINMGSTGPGGLPYVATNMIQKIHGVKFNLVAFDGEGPAITALMGGHIDAVAVGLLAASTYIVGDTISGLAVISPERIESVKNVPTVLEAFPGEYDSYLPWGAFFGVFVKKGTPSEAQNKLKEAFLKSYNDPRFAEFADKMGGVKLGLTGDDARKYIEQNKSVSAWLLYDAGGAKVSPEEFKIPRP
ncbi:hypothetical protein AGMMS50276_11220 [Synergistales bacterium]|nr:hypothetical protein AGMMS50276_11220 [Synergistales bacterium]